MCPPRRPPRDNANAAAPALAGRYRRAAWPAPPAPARFRSSTSLHPRPRPARTLPGPGGTSYLASTLGPRRGRAIGRASRICGRPWFSAYLEPLPRDRLRRCRPRLRTSCWLVAWRDTAPLARGREEVTVSEQDRLEAAVSECREMIREAHAATKDLRAAVRE